MQHFGWKSTNAWICHFKALVKKGYAIRGHVRMAAEYKIVGLMQVILRPVEEFTLKLMEEARG